MLGWTTESNGFGRNLIQLEGRMSGYGKSFIQLTTGCKVKNPWDRMRGINKLSELEMKP